MLTLEMVVVLGNQQGDCMAKKVLILTLIVDEDNIDEYQNHLKEVLSASPHTHKATFKQLNEVPVH